MSAAPAATIAPAASIAPAPRARRRRWLTVTPAIPVVVAVALGLFRAGEKSVWLDEAAAVAIARLPTLDMLVFLWRSELHAAPYYLVLHPWLALGDSAVAIRALSVVFGAMAVLATWAIGRRYGVGFVAALLLAVTPVFVQYEQEARGYTLLIAASALATLLYLRLADAPDRWRAALYVVAGGGLIYIHPLGALVVAAHGLAALVFVAPAQRRRVLAVFLPVGLLWLPMLRFALLNRDRIDWIPATTVALAGTELVALGGGLLTGVVLVVLLVLGTRRDALLPWLVVPILGTLAMSLLIQPLFVMRYLVTVLPAAALIAARNRPQLVAALLVASLAGVWAWYEAVDAKDDWRSAAAWVRAEVEPADGIVFAPHYLRLPLGYYVRVGEPLWPHLPWSESDLLKGSPPDPATVAARPRVWLIEGHIVELPPEVSAGLAGFVEAESRSYAGPHGLRVTLLTRPGQPPP